MRRRIASGFLTRVSSLAVVLLAQTSQAGVTVYTDKASFLAASPCATLQATFEGHALGPTGPFSEGGLSFASPFNNMYVIGPGLPGTTIPLPPTRMLCGNGQENIDVTIASGTSPSLGFVLLQNGFGPGAFQLFDASNALIFTYSPTQALNTIGFVGFVSTTPIKRMNWFAAAGHIENTALDDLYYGDCNIPTRRSTWGAVKEIYR